MEKGVLPTNVKTSKSTTKIERFSDVAIFIQQTTSLKMIYFKVNMSLVILRSKLSTTKYNHFKMVGHNVDLTVIYMETYICIFMRVI